MLHPVLQLDELTLQPEQLAKVLVVMLRHPGGKRRAQHAIFHLELQRLVIVIHHVTRNLVHDVFW